MKLFNKTTCLLFLFCYMYSPVSAQDADSLRNAYIENRNEASTWNMDLLREDISSSVDKPMKFGAFPVPVYSQNDPDYNGLSSNVYPGIQGFYKDIEGQRLLYSSASIGKNSWNQEWLDERNTETFFHIVVLTDSIDEQTYKHFGNQVVSRNHPDYAVQGFFETSVGSIEYVAFQTATRDAYALVNMRLFDLNKGNTILIAPHKDGSFRSMQIASPPLSAEQVDSYTDKLIEQTEVREFFTHPEAITWDQ